MFWMKNRKLYLNLTFFLENLLKSLVETSTPVVTIQISETVDGDPAQDEPGGKTIPLSRFPGCLCISFCRKCLLHMTTISRKMYKQVFTSTMNNARIFRKQYVVFWAIEKIKSFFIPMYSHNYFSIAQNKTSFSPKLYRNIKHMCRHLWNCFCDSF